MTLMRGTPVRGYLCQLLFPRADKRGPALAGQGSTMLRSNASVGPTQCAEQRPAQIALVHAYEHVVTSDRRERNVPSMTFPSGNVRDEWFGLQRSEP